MNTSTPRSWTIDDRIDDFKHRGIIQEAFTPEARELAGNLAAAYFFIWEQQELPGRCLEKIDGQFTAEMNALDMGIQRVRQIRGDF